MKNKNYKGMIWPVDHERKLKYIKMKAPRFDFHPDYPGHEVFVITNDQGTPAKNAKLQYFQQIRFGRLLYSTSIIETGDLDLLRGKAAVYYHERRNQFERKVIKDVRGIVRGNKIEVKVYKGKMVCGVKEVRVE